MQVHSRSEQCVDVVLSKLHTLPGKQLLLQLWIPAACKTGAIWQRKGSGSAVHTNAGGTVCDADNGNAIGKQTVCHTAEGAAAARRYLGRIHTLSTDDTA